jgi:lysophospholipase L1-like esterase
VVSLALKLALSPLLVAQALRTRARVPRLPEAAGARAGVAGRGTARLRLLIAGDSSAAGVGVATQHAALSGQLLPRLAARCAARIEWSLVARSGLTTAQAFELLRGAALPVIDLAVVVTGVNDVVDQVSSLRAVQAREGIANLLRNGAGAQHVVFCPLPPIHQFPALPQPLRWMAGADAQRHNRALRHWAGERGARSGDVSTLALDRVHLSRDAMASDGFHPGAPVYRAVAEALAEHVAQHVMPRLRLESFSKESR